MPLTNLHLIAVHQNYLLSRDLEIKRFEDAGLLAGTDPRSLGPREDILANSAFIGYGIDFLKNLPADIQTWYAQANLSAFFTPADLTLLTNYHSNPTATNLQALLASFTHLPNEPAAAALLVAAVNARESLFNARLGFVLPESNERAALMSMFYNGGAGIVGKNLLNALQGDNRAEAWYEIRYGSNGDGGHARRRYAEANLFGLYEDAIMSETEAKSIFRMYTAHREDIWTYESQFSPYSLGHQSFVAESATARNKLFELFLVAKQFGSEFVTLPAIDGEVLVGNDSLRGDLFDVRLVSIPGAPAYLFDLSRNDLMLGEAGRDFMHGRGGNDVLYGGTSGDDLYGDQGQDVLFGDDGEDTLQGGDDVDALFGGDGRDILVGGEGNDKLAGGEGFDTYIWNTGDGNDRIEDSDAQGVIKVNGQMLVGGVKKTGQTDWTSSDGTIRYRMSGTDLIVELNGTQIMTVNENFQSGQFGIRLIDAGTLPAGLPTTSRTIEGDHELKDFNPDPEIVEWRADDLDNFLYDPGVPVPYQDILRGSGGNDRIDAGELRDYLFGLGGDDVLVGGGGNDRLLGGDGNDFLFSDGVIDLAGLPSLNTFTGVGTLQEFLNGDADNDVLVGGAVGDGCSGRLGRISCLGVRETTFWLEMPIGSRI